ncbi:hypothetical protein [Mycobacterium sp. OAE908]|uniref:hypothetical protein n=1 Tax=Mycobacterium sp. OAE908 TaxID=2817899 RepID=UPI001AE8DFFC
MTDHRSVAGRSPQRAAHDPLPPTGARRVSRMVDNTLSVVLFAGQIALWGVAFISFIALPMSIDNCAYQDCGPEKWIDYAMLTVALSAPAGAIFSGAGIYLLATRKVGFWAPLLGCAVQVAMLAAAWLMAGNAGPIH